MNSHKFAYFLAQSMMQGTVDPWWVVPGLINCVAAYQPKGAASLANSYVDLSGTGNDAAPGVAPTWGVDTGWVFDGATQYLVTGVVPNSQYSMIARFAAATESEHVIGAGQIDVAGTEAFYLLPRSTSDDHGFGFGDGIVITGSRITNGVLAISDSYGYLDGAQEIDINGSWNTTLDDVYIGAGNTNGAAVLFYTGQVMALAIYDADLSAGQIASLTTRINAL